MIPPYTRNPPASLSHHQSSHMSQTNPVLPVEQQMDSRSLLFSHTQHNIPNTMVMVPSLAASGCYTEARPVSDAVQASMSSTGANAMFQSVQYSPPSPSYATEYAPSSAHANFSTRAQPPRHNGSLLSATDNNHGSTLRDYSMSMEDQYIPGSPENGLHNDICVGETLTMWEASHSAESPSDSASLYTAPQLTSPANQRAATARRKRVAKYTCDMCGSRLTAKHNLTSKFYA